MEKQALAPCSFLDALPGGDEAFQSLTLELPNGPDQLQLQQLPPDPLTSSSSRHQASALPLPPEAEEDKRQPVEDQLQLLQPPPQPGIPRD